MTDAAPPVFAVDGDALQALNRDALQATLITPDCLYLELALFKDLRLGAALAHLLHTRSEAEAGVAYQALLDGLPAYRTRAFYDVPHYFPALGVDNPTLDRLLADPAWSDRIFDGAPNTHFHQLLRANLLVNLNHSAVAGTKHTRGADGRLHTTPIRFLVNTYPLALSASRRQLLAHYLVRSYGVDAEFHCVDPRALPLALIERADELYTAHLGELTQNPAFRARASSGAWLQKHLFVAPYLGYTVLPDEDASHYRSVVHDVLDLMFEVAYIPVSILTPGGDYTPPDVEAMHGRRHAQAAADGA